MGTNYYLHIKECNFCGRSEPIHIGKKSAGWTFLFRGYRVGELEDVKITIATRMDWELILSTLPGTVKDEYGRVVIDPLRQLRSLKPPTVKQLLEENRITRAYESTDRVWRDREGFRFCRGEFH